MRDTQTGVPLRRRWLRLLDGDRPWGSIDVIPDRFGMTRYRLVVFPPGISADERRRIRLARTWPLWATLAWIVCEVWLSHVTGPLTAFAISTAAFIGVGVVATTKAGAHRAQVRTMTVMVSAGYRDPQLEAIRDKLSRLAVTLMDADERLGRGQISAADHELTWWQVYDDIGVGSRRLVRRTHDGQRPQGRTQSPVRRA